GWSPTPWPSSSARASTASSRTSTPRGDRRGNRTSYAEEQIVERGDDRLTMAGELSAKLAQLSRSDRRQGRNDEHVLAVQHAPMRRHAPDGAGHPRSRRQRGNDPLSAGVGEIGLQDRDVRVRAPRPYDRVDEDVELRHSVLIAVVVLPHHLGKRAVLR